MRVERTPLRNMAAAPENGEWQQGPVCHPDSTRMSTEKMENHLKDDGDDAANAGDEWQQAEKCHAMPLGASDAGRRQAPAGNEDELERPQHARQGYIKKFCTQVVALYIKNGEQEQMDSPRGGGGGWEGGGAQPGLLSTDTRDQPCDVGRL